LWTENEGGFQVWGESPTNTTSYFWGRTNADIAGSIAAWFARGGSHMNYYMYYGGNHYGPWAGASITHMYASDVNICPDNLPHEPKFTHLRRLHALLADYADVIAYNPAQMNREQHLLWYNNKTKSWQQGKQQLAFVYKTGQKQLAFVENDANVSVVTQFNGRSYDMPAYSVSLVDGTGKELYNTAKVLPARSRRITAPVTNTPFQWRVWSEPVMQGLTRQYPALKGSHPFEQSSVLQTLPGAWPSTQYLWYETNVTLTTALPASASLVLAAEYAEGLMLFVDGQLAGSCDNHDHTEGNLTLKISNVGRFFTRGTHQIAILSESFGFNNGMSAGSTRKFKGITGSVMLGTRNLTIGSWVMRPALVGEVLQVFTTKGASRVSWSTEWQSAAGKPVTWFQTAFTKPDLASGEVLLLDTTGMGRGHFYLNGRDMGRYWMIDMNDGSGKPIQHLYLIPLDWLVSGPNLLTLGEVLGAPNPSTPRLFKRRMVSGLGNAHDVTCPM